MLFPSQTPEARKIRYRKNRRRILAQAHAARQNREARKTPEQLEANRLAVYKYKLRTLYGLTPDQWLAMREAQGDRCAVCGKTGTSMRHNSNLWLCIDHDHATGKVRALLCQRCNSGLGNFFDSPELLESAAAYLRSHRGN